MAYGLTSKSLSNFGEGLHAYVRSITFLDLSYNKLDSFPVGLHGLRNLYDLSLSHNVIEEAPRSLGVFLHTLMKT